jgi:hypothetical protein
MHATVRVDLKLYVWLVRASREPHVNLRVLAQDVQPLLVLRLLEPLGIE